MSRYDLSGNIFVVDKDMSNCVTSTKILLQQNCKRHQLSHEFTLKNCPEKNYPVIFFRRTCLTVSVTSDNLTSNYLWTILEWNDCLIDYLIKNVPRTIVQWYFSLAIVTSTKTYHQIIVTAIYRNLSDDDFNQTAPWKKLTAHSFWSQRKLYSPSDNSFFQHQTWGNSGWG